MSYAAVAADASLLEALCSSPGNSTYVSGASRLWNWCPSLPFEEARALYLVDDIEEADRVVRAMLPLSRDDPLAYYWLGRIAWEAGRMEDARSEWVRGGILRVIAGADFSRGLAAFQKGDLGLAERHWQKAVAVDPEYGEAYYRLGQLYWTVGRLKKAAEVFEMSLAYLQDGYPRNVARGKLCIIRSDWRCAAEAFGEACRLNDSDVSSFLHWSDALVRIADENAAEDVLRHAQSLHAEDSRLWLELGNLYLRRGLWKPAVVQLEQAVRLAPQSLDAWIGLSRAYVGAMETESAKMAIERALEIAPENPTALGLKAKIAR